VIRLPEGPDESQPCADRVTGHPVEIGQRTATGHRATVVGARVGGLCEIGNGAILGRVGPRIPAGRKPFFGPSRERADTAEMDHEPWRAAWTGWTVPAALRGLVPTGSTATPVEALWALFGTAVRRLTGRRVTVPGTGGLALHIEALQVRPDPLGLTLGQFGDVRLVARDVEWRDWVCARVVVSLRNLHLRPPPAAAVVTAPVDVEIVLSSTIVAARLAAVRPGAAFETARQGGAAEALLRWKAHPRWGALVIVPEVTATALHLRPVGARLGRLHCALPGWLPPLRIRLPALPRDLRLRDVVVGAGEIVLHLVADEWRERLPGTRVAAVARWLEQLA
jgi:hypothetical protein